MDNQDSQTINTYDEIKEIEDDWESFPWKIDYLLYILFSQDSLPIDILLICKSEEYVFYNMRKSNRNVVKYNLDRYPISKNQLFSSMNIKDSDDSEPITFQYVTQIFEQPLYFRCHKDSSNIISLRHLDRNSALNPITHFINVINFNEKLEKYLMFSDLNKQIPSKQYVENKRKI